MADGCGGCVGLFLSSWCSLLVFGRKMEKEMLLAQKRHTTQQLQLASGVCYYIPVSLQKQSNQRNDLLQWSS